MSTQVPEEELLLIDAAVRIVTQKGRMEGLICRGDVTIVTLGDERFRGRGVRSARSVQDGLLGRR